MNKPTTATSEDAWAILAQIMSAGWDDQRQAITDGLASLEAMCSSESVWALWTLQCRARREQVRRHAGLALEASATTLGKTAWGALNVGFEMPNDAKLRKLVRDAVLNHLESSMNARHVFHGESVLSWMRDRVLKKSLASLVFQTSAGETFRIANGTGMDVDGESAAVGETVEVAHAALMTAHELQRWNDHLAEYQLQQPFEQLGRRVFHAERITRNYVGVRLDIVRAHRALSQQGWVFVDTIETLKGMRCSRLDTTAQFLFSKALPKQEVLQRLGTSSKGVGDDRTRGVRVERRTR
ncbi:MAG: DUF4132 domain-containing protein [bacterium]